MTHYHYETVTEAIKELREQGYTVDFNLQENCLICDMGNYNADEFDIKEIYHYEGNSDPGDEATVYGIQSHSGVRGLLVTGDEMTMDNVTAEILQKLRFR